MNDMSAKIQTRLLGSEPHISISLNKMNSFVPENKKKWNKLHHFLKQSKSIKHIRYIKKQELIIKTQSSGLQSVIAKEFQKKDFPIFLNSTYKHYPHLKPRDSFEYKKPALKSVYIEETLAQHLQIHEGDKVLLFKPKSLLSNLEDLQAYEQLEVKGLLPSETKTSTEKFIYFANFNLNNTSEIFPIEISLHHPYEYKTTLLAIHQFAKSIKLALITTNWKKDNHVLFFSLNMEKSIMGLFFIISLIINSLSMMTLIFLLITQKRKDIGILYAMGFSQKHIKSLFMKISFILSLIGMLIGLTIGLSLSIYLKYKPLQILPDIFYNNALSAKIDLPILFLSLVSIIFFSYIGAWIPIHLQFKKLKIQYQL